MQPSINGLTSACYIYGILSGWLSLRQRKISTLVEHWIMKFLHKDARLPLWTHCNIFPIKFQVRCWGYELCIYITSRKLDIYLREELFKTDFPIFRYHSNRFLMYMVKTSCENSNINICSKYSFLKLLVWRKCIREEVGMGGSGGLHG